MTVDELIERLASLPSEVHGCQVEASESGWPYEVDVVEIERLTFCGEPRTTILLKP